MLLLEFRVPAARMSSALKAHSYSMQAQCMARAISPGAVKSDHEVEGSIGHLKKEHVRN